MIVDIVLAFGVAAKFCGVAALWCVSSASPLCRTCDEIAEEASESLQIIEEERINRALLESAYYNEIF